jgi:hypothetical protein
MTIPAKAFIAGISQAPHRKAPNYTRLAILLS